MKKISMLLLSSILVLVSLSSLSYGAEKPAKIGVVNVDLLLKQAPQAKAATKSLEKEFAPQQVALRKSAKALEKKQAKYKKNLMVLNEAQKAAAQREISMTIRELQRKQSDLQESVNIRRNAELAKLQDLVNKAIKYIGKKQGFDLILYDGIAYTNNRLDVTQAVLAYLKKTYSTKRSGFNQ